MIIPALTLTALTCEQLATLKLRNATITDARTIIRAKFTPPQPASPEFFKDYDRLPPFCRVQATLTPSRDSHIEAEVWLPSSRSWNGRLLGAGNGGLAGSIPYFRLGEAVNSGYAVTATDTGHKGRASDASWAEGHPEKQTDFDYRAIHETAVLAKAVMRAYYGRPPDHSYFNACSNGGRQGLMEAERFAEDYDGILAGAPAWRMGFNTHLAIDFDAFAVRGGKIAIYHGGNDSPGSAIELYDRLVTRMGKKRVDEFLRLFIVPGMGHCGSGAVPNDLGQWVRPGDDAQHSLLKALEAWTEKGIAPECVTATQWKTDGDASSGVLKTSQICRYPATAAAGNP